ncbi:6-phosphogluconolactonase [Candidatus Peribacteria bacterium]|nr:6-phosphogluconolactonase [Candidatus Peribacteria bacterium]
MVTKRRGSARVCVMQELHTRTEREFVHTAALHIADAVERAIAQRGQCILGLSGGSTPRPVYEALATMQLPWEHLRIFLVDERYVPADHAESNQHLIKETLLQGTNITTDHLCFPDTDLPLSQCIERYALSLHTLCSDHLPDLVVLGMGEDGHIASLFPPVSELALGDQALIIHTITDAFAVHDRISVSLNLLACSDEQLFLLKGEKKKKIWAEMLKSKEGDSRWPAKRILKGERATVVWG